MNAVQMTLADIELQEKQARIKAVAAELDRLYKGCAATIGRKHFAALCDKSYTYINEILNSNNEQEAKPFQAGMIAALLVEAPDAFFTSVVGYMCDLADREYPRKKRPMTAEDEVKFLWRTIKAHGLEKLFEVNHG